MGLVQAVPSPTEGLQDRTLISRTERQEQGTATVPDNIGIRSKVHPRCSVRSRWDWKQSYSVGLEAIEEAGWEKIYLQNKSEVLPDQPDTSTPKAQTGSKGPGMSLNGLLDRGEGCEWDPGEAT